MFEWNWADLIIAFLGFLSAIGAAVLACKINDCITVRKTVNKLCEELDKEISSNHYEMYSERIVKGEELNFRLVELPYLEGIRASKHMDLLADKKWFGDLVVLLNDMDEINKWATMSTRFFICEAEALKGKTAEGTLSLSKRINYAILDYYKGFLNRIDKLYNKVKQKEN